MLADDLTGACDVGVGALAAGRSVRCVFFPVAGRRSHAGSGMTVLDLETRRLAPGAAGRRAARAGRWLRARGIRARYFKIDSTLRGHPVAEAEAVRRETGSPLAWLVPANPAMGRLTVGGRQFVNGLPLEATQYAGDPLNPVRTGNLMEMCAGSLGRRSCAHLRLEDLRRGPRHVRRLRRGWLARGVRLVTVDIAGESDLRRLAACVPAGDLPVGAAALARHMLARGAARRKAGSARPGRDGDMAARGLAVLGSMNPLTGRQVRRAGRARGVEVRWFGPGDIRRRAVALPGPDVRWLVLALAPARFRRFLASGPGKGERTARDLARLAARTAGAWKPGTLLMSGGLTAACVCEAMGIPELRLRREVEPGLVLSEARWGTRAIRVLTKPGGFGRMDALARVMRGTSR